MENSLTYSIPLSVYNKNLSLNDWFKSVDFYEKGDYSNTMVHLLRYINPPSKIPDGPELDLKIPHGSIIVNVRLTKEKLSIKAPFLKFTPSSLRLPSMRQMLENNFSSFVLAQTVLRGDELWIEYETPVENCEPYKIWDVLSEICMDADRNDDYYIDRYKLVSVNEMQFDRFTRDEAARASEEFKKIIEEGLSYADYLEGKRYHDMQCDVMAITLMRLKYVIFPQGILGREIQDVISGMYEKLPVETIATRTKEKLKKLLSFDSAKFNDSLYHPKFFMPIKPVVEIVRIQEHLENAYKTLAQSLSDKAYMYCSIYGIYELYNLMDAYTLPTEILQGVETTLRSCDSVNWKSTAEIIYQYIDSVMDIEETTIDSEDESFYEEQEVKKEKNKNKDKSEKSLKDKAVSKATDIAVNAAKSGLKSLLRDILKSIFKN